MILKSCEAILFKGYNSKEAATMFQRNQNVSYDEDYYDEIIEENDRYAIYGGYNGYDDDTIDYGFDGKPEAKEGRANYPSDRLKKVPYPIY